MIGVYSYIFKKPVKDASGYALQPTITVISHLIISEISFYQQMIKIKQFQLQYGLLMVLLVKTLNKIKQVLNIPSNQALAHFLGQVAHETANFNLDTENLNYSAAGLVSTFKKYFPTPESTAGYARQPKR
jgi:predicted chitinase